MKHSDSHSSQCLEQDPHTKLVRRRSKGLGGSVIPEPLTPYPYKSTAFFTVIFVNTPLNPYLATGFKPGFKTRTVVTR